MKKLLYAKDSEECWQITSEEREKRWKKLARLPFARKVEILEKMQADATLLRSLYVEKGRSSASLSPARCIWREQDVLFCLRL